MKNCLVVPLYNEESRFNLDYWNEVIVNSSFYFLFVDDGSTDGTASILDCLNYQNVSVLHLRENVGKSEAVRLGFQYIISKSIEEVNLLGYIDGDHAFKDSEVINILNTADQVFIEFLLDALWMSRVKLSGYNINRGVFRHIVGRFIATFLGFGISRFPYDTQCGFKLFKNNNYFAKTLTHEFRTRWFVDLEIFCRYSKNKGSWMVIRELPLKNWWEVNGSRIKIKAFYSIAFEILKIRRSLILVKKEVTGGSARN